MSTRNKQGLGQRTWDLLRAIFTNNTPEEQEEEIWNLPATNRSPDRKEKNEFDDEEQEEWSSYTK